MMGYSYRQPGQPPPPPPQHQQQPSGAGSDEASLSYPPGPPPDPAQLASFSQAEAAAAAAAAAAGMPMVGVGQQQQQQQQQQPPYMMQHVTSQQGQPSPGGHHGAYVENIAPAPPHHAHHAPQGPPGHQQHALAPAVTISTTPTIPAVVSGQGRPPSVSPTSAGTAGTYYDPFAHILNKANLTVEGNLDDMLENWTEEEKENQRRLVQFWRRQQGNEVMCSFSPISQSERPQQNAMIVVSCIYWKEKDDYYITSVDCIYLLENLIGVRFTVEEKNRIRRNLEGFKPLTVSKIKADSAEFFKLIMAFPNPKPRNIEKDVKVFAWRSLAHALKKIISKYTASYSSTASVNIEALQQPGPSSAGGPGDTSPTSL
ncbi:hypothetical protein BCR43DRAFT_483477 [Syncephalastrum racemosum]|uniref:DUF7082 domain-containing protein n=1 Tax=Syncephalastrum racemosum TaxID=13706 RepID=A0A1X2HVE2_SYNRA|nr:hypothetical protein BCR43DRAFT_483477 [Syncephalastrum racemosum]